MEISLSVLRKMSNIVWKRGIKENEKAISRRTKRAMVRPMCGQKVVDRKMTEEQIDMLGLKETIDRLATANGVRWYGHGEEHAKEG